MIWCLEATQNGLSKGKGVGIHKTEGEEQYFRVLLRIKLLVAAIQAFWDLEKGAEEAIAIALAIPEQLDLSIWQEESHYKTPFWQGTILRGERLFLLVIAKSSQKLSLDT